MRAWVVVNCQLTVWMPRLRRDSHASVSARRSSVVAIGLSVHSRERVLSSILAILSQLACLGGGVNLQLLCDSHRLGWSERLVQRANGMRVQVVHHQHDFLRVGISLVDQFTHALGKVDPPPMLGHFHVSLAAKRLEHHENIGMFNFINLCLPIVGQLPQIPPLIPRNSAKSETLNC
jgi:hypothetical protein